jgi:gamma-glutamylcyclotransferase (GGCT)/AIG2-like uncharacterized protein YtfP
MEFSKAHGARKHDFLGNMISNATLPDHRLSFNRFSSRWNGGVLSVEEKIGCYVEGTLFFVVDEEVLKQKEGAGRSYDPKEITVLVDGKEVRAFTYIAIPESTFCKPTQEYLSICTEGRLSLQLDLSPLIDASNDSQNRCKLNDVFVYGTLMRGECRHRIANSRANLLMTLMAETNGLLLDANDYPVLIQDESRPWEVQGELHRFNSAEDIISKLDQVEGFKGYGQPGSLFRRTICSYGLKDGSGSKAWVYVGASDVSNLKELESGCWRTHSGSLDVFLEKLHLIHGIKPTVGNRSSDISEHEVAKNSGKFVSWDDWES